MLLYSTLYISHISLEKQSRRRVHVRPLRLRTGTHSTLLVAEAMPRLACPASASLIPFLHRDLSTPIHLIGRQLILFMDEPKRS